MRVTFLCEQCGEKCYGSFVTMKMGCLTEQCGHELSILISDRIEGIREEKAIRYVDCSGLSDEDIEVLKQYRNSKL